jgi:thioredoxin reductase (NADPH)
VVFLAPQVKRLHLVARRPLEATMSRYLIDRIAALPNVTLHIGSEIAALDGDCQTGLTGATFRDRADGSTKHCPLKHLFLFIGADPNTGWLAGCVETDGNGFICTGLSEALPLETSRPGIFAIGDVRAGSVKRVAAGVGEGAAVVAQIHKALAAQHEEATR